ncbi:MAG: hypothetical protein K2X29_02920, partial [Candidatus Obscuribacterales bacterium]|nr:hypothetical protein [Candidatus Obscuribacterales bacterium]
MTDIPTKRPWRLWINQLAAVWLPIAIVSAFLTFAGFFGDRDWLFELADVFRVQYAIVLFAGVAIFLAARRRIVMVIALIALVANCYALAPCFLPSKSQAA